MGQVSLLKHNSSKILFLAEILLAGMIIVGIVGFTPTLRHKIAQFIKARKTVHAVTQRDIQNYINTQTIEHTLSVHSLKAASGPLRVDSSNPRYFSDGQRVVYLTGSHTWLNLQDGVLTDPPPAFDYTLWLDFLEAHHHNFFRLYVWEEAKWVTEWAEPYYFAPLPYERTGPGVALDGKPKFDLTKFNQAYFDRLRQRVQAAGDRGIYVSIMLFNGWSVAYPKGQNQAANPWLGHPFNLDNNVNGINGDPNQDKSGVETQALTIPEVTALQEAYVAKIIDTVNDLDNVLYEISNESDAGSQAWQYHMINFIKAYEAGKPQKHPVGMTAEWPGGTNDSLFASPADWISPNGALDNPPAAEGRKVIISDTDHLCGICGDRTWVWKSFTRGLNPIFMDQYDDSYKLDGGGYDMNNATDVSLRHNLGYTRRYADRMNLAAMIPHGELASTGYCLANPAAQAAEYLVYLPAGGKVTVDLAAAVGPLNVEWFNPATGVAAADGATPGGNKQEFTAPFNGDAVLYLYQTSSPVTPTPTLTSTSTPLASSTASPSSTPTFVPTSLPVQTSSPSSTPSSTPTFVPTSLPVQTPSPSAPTFVPTAPTESGYQLFMPFVDKSTP